MRRRTFLASATSSCVLPYLPPLMASAQPSLPRIVDTHTHFYDPSRKEGVPWPGRGTSLYRPVFPKDWLEVASPHGVQETVVVEASAWLEDNQWILDLADREKSILGFVGHLSPGDLEFPVHLKRFGRHPKFLGIRVGGDLNRSMEDEKFRKGIRLLSDLGLELDINGPPKIQGAILKIAKEIPSLRIVVNHVGGAGDPSKLSDEWKSNMELLGKQGNIFCKVSALTEQTDESKQRPGSAPRDLEYYRPILDHCWNVFGEDRLIYGSNWPVCEKGGSYSDQFRLVREFFATKGIAASEKYFWKNAQTAYRWKEA